jgi:hypothetical protein
MVLVQIHHGTPVERRVQQVALLVVPFLLYQRQAVVMGLEVTRQMAHMYRGMVVLGAGVVILV